ncbi:unnamed protein product [Linum tenue]|uniref:MTTase N-terminal domain-containing protein n=1 Tax=Linum tenue TaxID=586396 RepID=A0AAV0RJU8_9ROSI|nr:unnamed protein product [Linum tenue]
MEDIEDLLIGSGGGAPPGFRLPLNTVAVKPKKNVKNGAKLNGSLLSESSLFSTVPGTQTIYIKTFGCSHNQASYSALFSLEFINQF